MICGLGGACHESVVKCYLTAGKLTGFSKTHSRVNFRGFCFCAKTNKGTVSIICTEVLMWSTSKLYQSTGTRTLKALLVQSKFYLLVTIW